MATLRLPTGCELLIRPKLDGCVRLVIDIEAPGGRAHSATELPGAVVLALAEAVDTGRAWSTSPGRVYWVPANDRDPGALSITTGRNSITLRMGDPDRLSAALLEAAQATTRSGSGRAPV